MSKGRDDVDGEANEEWTHGRVDGAEERKNNGQKPYGNDDGQSSCGSFA